MLPEDQEDILNIHTPGPEPSVLRMVIGVAVVGVGLGGLLWAAYLFFIGNLFG